MLVDPKQGSRIILSAGLQPACFSAGQWCRHRVARPSSTRPSQLLVSHHAIMTDALMRWDGRPELLRTHCHSEVSSVKRPRAQHSRAQTHLPARLRFSHACVLRMRQVCSTSSARASLWSCMGGKRLIPLIRQNSARPDGMTLLRVCGGPAVSCGVRVACMSNIGPCDRHAS